MAATRDCTTAPPGGGSCSLRTSSYGPATDWYQPLPNLYPGVPLLTRFWGRVADAANPNLAQGGARFPPSDGSPPPGSVSPTATDPTAEYEVAWGQFPLLRSAGVPGDAQITATQLGAARFGAVPSVGTAKNIWVDLGEVWGLGTALRYDRQGRLSRLWTPDNATVRLQHDRFGRLVRHVDAQGRVTRLAWDALDRLVRVVDPEGHETLLAWDEVGRLASVTDARGSVTLYIHDDCDRLTEIRYPDDSRELFTWYANGLLKTYKDNATTAPAILCEFFYDDVDRLVRLEFPADQSEILFTHDEVGNVTSRTERNGDVTVFRRDALDRVTGEVRVPAGDSLRWGHGTSFDANGNRLGLEGADYGARYGASRYQPSTPPDPTARYSLPDSLWSVPAEGGFDERNRLKRFLDQDGNETRFDYDLDGRRTRIEHQLPASTPIVTRATHDILGRVVRLETVKDNDTLLDLRYGYDLSSNRTSQVTQTDTFEYGLDKAGRLVEESINRLVMRRPEVFQRGEAVQVEVDPDLPAVRMLGLDDPFSDHRLNADRWRLVYSGSGFGGFEVRQQGALEFTFPRGYSNYVYATDQLWNDYYGMRTEEVWAGAQHRVPLSGDFAVSVAFQEWQAYAFDGVQMGLLVQDQPLGQNSSNRLLMALEYTPGGGHVYRGRVVSAGTTVENEATPISDVTGKLQVRRVGSTVYLERWDATGEEWVEVASYADFSEGTLYVSLSFAATFGLGTVRWEDFQRSDGPRPEQATYTSPVYDCGREGVTWNTLSWEEGTLPSGTDLEFQVAVSGDPAGSWDFVGPDGTAATFFTTPAGEALPTLTGRYARYRAFFTGNGTATAEFTRVDLTYSGALDSSLRLYAFDGAGNMVRKTVETEGAATVTEVRDDESWPAQDRINSLNQLRRNDITVSGSGTTTWRYDWDLNGNLLKKYKEDDSEVWDYGWSDENRLIRVVKTVNSVVTLDVAYTYDSLGRMLTRKLSTDTHPTRFEWDGWDLVREVDPAGVETVYYAPEGEIFSFKRGSSVYQVHADALGSVRTVTDSAGTSVADFDIDAWGQTLSASGSLASSVHMRFVGALGVRLDSGTSLYYMRNRWYDTTGTFISRDPLLSVNAYRYCRSNPTTLIDPLGLVPRPLSDQPIEAGDVSEQKLVQMAIDLIRSTGFGSTADALQQLLSSGKIYYDPDDFTGQYATDRGDTKSGDHININAGTMCLPLSSVPQMLRPRHQFMRVVNMAGTLMHEYQHYIQPSSIHEKARYNEWGEYWAYNQEGYFLSVLYDQRAGNPTRYKTGVVRAARGSSRRLYEFSTQQDLILSLFEDALRSRDNYWNNRESVPPSLQSSTCSTRCPA